LDFALETLYDVIDDVQPLLEKHYEELGPKGIAALNPRWDVYAELERLGFFAVFTARAEGVLKGYAAFFVQKNMHYADMTVAANDVFFLTDDVRAGMTPAKFLRYIEQQLGGRGVHKIVYHCKTTNNLAPLLNRLGYTTEEAMCAKLLRAA
jgi:hypothetical protein